MQNSKHIANSILVIMIIGFLAFYPYRATWYFGLLCHIFGAGMIGGFADWYAVTALFGKPLGISWKTNLLVRRHEDLIEEAHNMIMKELLVERYIYQVLKKSSFADNDNGTEKTLIETIAAYILSAEGRGQVHSILMTVVSPMCHYIDMNLIVSELKILATRGIDNWKVSPLLVSLLEQLLKPEPLRLLWKNSMGIAKHLIASKVIRPYLLTLVRNILIHYSSNTLFREAAVRLAGDVLDPERIVDMIQKKGAEYLEEQADIDSKLAKRVITKAHLLVDELKYNAQWQKKVEAYKTTYLTEAFNNSDFFSLNLNDKVVFDNLLATIERHIITFVANVYIDEEKKTSINRLFLYLISETLKKVHPFIDAFVRKQLESYSAEEISEGLKGKVGYDLQLVRVNGSLVGAALGGLFYAASLAIKAVI